MNQILINPWTPVILLAIGALFSIIGTFLAMNQQTAHEKLLRERTEKIVNIVTSGDAYPWATINPTQGKEHILNWVIMNSSDEYPLYNVQLRIVDTIKMQETIEINKKEGRPIFSNRNDYERSFIFGTLGPSKGVTPPPMNLEEHSTVYSYNLFFNHRYGAVQQYFEGKKIDGSWTIKYRVEKLDGEILKDFTNF